MCDYNTGIMCGYNTKHSKKICAGMTFFYLFEDTNNVINNARNATSTVKAREAAKREPDNLSTE